MTLMVVRTHQAYQTIKINRFHNQITIMGVIHKLVKYKILIPILAVFKTAIKWMIQAWAL